MKEFWKDYKEMWMGSIEDEDNDGFLFLTFMHLFALVLLGAMIYWFKGFGMWTFLGMGGTASVMALHRYLHNRYKRDASTHTSTKEAK